MSEGRRAALTEWLRGLRAGGYELAIDGKVAASEPTQMVITYVDDLEQVALTAETLNTGRAVPVEVRVVAKRGRFTFEVPCESYGDATAILEDALA